MAAISVTLTKINKLANGRIIVSFGKRGREFASIADLREFVRDTISRDVMESLFLRLAIDRQANLDTPAAFEGRTLTIDTSLASWGKVN